MALSSLNCKIQLSFDAIDVKQHCRMMRMMMYVYIYDRYDLPNLYDQTSTNQRKDPSPVTFVTGLVLIYPIIIFKYFEAQCALAKYRQEGCFCHVLVYIQYMNKHTYICTCTVWENIVHWCTPSLCIKMYKYCFLLFFEGRLRLVNAASPKYVTIILLYFLSQ